MWAYSSTTAQSVLRDAHRQVISCCSRANGADANVEKQPTTAQRALGVDASIKFNHCARAQGVDLCIEPISFTENRNGLLFGICSTCYMQTTANLLSRLPCVMNKSKNWHWNTPRYMPLRTIPSKVQIPINELSTLSEFCDPIFQFNRSEVILSKS